MHARRAVPVPATRARITRRATAALVAVAATLVVSTGAELPRCRATEGERLWR